MEVGEGGGGASEEARAVGRAGGRWRAASKGGGVLVDLLAVTVRLCMGWVYAKAGLAWDALL